jgi:hypothetical protein
MKSKLHFFVFFMALITFGFTACDDDDNNDDSSNASAIVGQWDVDLITTTVVTIEGTETGSQEPTDAWMDFKEDGTGVTSNDVSFTWTLSASNSLSLTFDKPDDDSGSPTDGFGDEDFIFSFEDLAGYETLVLEVKAIEDNYLALEYMFAYGTNSFTMEMELSR